MQSVFLRVYLGMLVAMFTAVFIAAVATYYTNEYRITQHITKYNSGMFRLVGEGIARHEGENRQRWFSAIEKLSGLYFEPVTARQSGLSGSELLSLKREGFHLKMDYTLTKGQAYIHLPGSDELLTVEMTDFGSTLVRASAFLVINELGRHKNKDRVSALKDIREMFEYPVNLRAIDGLRVSPSNLNLLQNGDIVVELKNTTVSSPELNAYAPVGNSPYVLKLGAIPLFNWFPLPLVSIVISVVLLFMATVTYLLVHPIERRLKGIDLKIEQIGNDQEISIVSASNREKDAIDRLDGTVDEMTCRIHRLIDAQADMVRAISHELRTPITRIRFRMSNIEDIEDITIKEETDGVERDLEELEKLIDEVLTFTKLKREKPEMQLEPIGLKTFFADIEQAISPLAHEVNVSFEQIDNIHFHGDRRFLHRAIENLILNAVRYANSKVNVQYVTGDKYQHICVSDDGPGIPANERTSIFEPFKRLDASRCRSSGGYGLGLAIVNQIAMWHQGSTQARESEWGGASMVFSWPLQLSPQE